jgi:AraC family transcriptional regulator
MKSVDRSIEPSRYEDGRPMQCAGLRRHHTFAGAAEGIPAQWQEFRQSGPIPHRQGTNAYGVICTGDPQTQTMEYMCAVEVSEFSPDAPHPGRMRVPPQHYAVFEHPGHVSTTHQTWDAIHNDWLPRSGRKAVNGPDFEVYAERFDPRTGTGGFEIWFPVEPV